MVDDKTSKVPAAANPRPDQPEIERTLPVIVPRSLLIGQSWPGPYELLRHEALGLAWAILTAGQQMLYVNRECADAWDRAGIDWKARALENLAVASKDWLWTHAKLRDDRRVVFAAMMHADGLGSSRALLRDEIVRTTGGRVRIGLPDRSCGLLFPSDVNDIDGRTPGTMTQGMFAKATSPLCGDLLTLEDLDVLGAG